MSENEFEERIILIEQMLDKIYPFEHGMSEEVRDSVDSNRQMLVMRAGWNTMSIVELRRVAAGRQ